MKIQRLKITNFMGIREVDLATGHVVAIEGKNRQGKTSILQAIQAAILGGNQSAKIRENEECAEIFVELDDLTIERIIKREGDDVLKLRRQNGSKVSSPQTYLNSLIGGFGFNPVEFFNLNKKEQVDYILQAFPLKVTPEDITNWIGDGAGVAINVDELTSLHAMIAVEKLCKEYYDLRRDANRVVEKKKNAMDEAEKKVPAIFDPKSFDADGLNKLYEQVRSAEKTNNRIDEITRLQTAIDVEIAELEKRLEGKRNEKTALATELVRLGRIDMSGLKNDIEKHEQKRRQLADYNEAVKLSNEYAEEKSKAERLNEIVLNLQTVAPKELTTRIKYPVANMAITDSGLTFDGKPFELLSGAEQLDVSLKIARALNGELKICCVDGVESLDDETFAAFTAMIDADVQTQYFTCQVANPRVGNGSVKIENGTIK